MRECSYAYFHLAGRSSPLNIRLFPESIVPASLATRVLLPGRATLHQSTCPLLQENAYGDGFSHDPRSIEQTAANTFLVRAGTDFSKYLYEIDCTGKKAHILDDSHSAQTWFNTKDQTGDELAHIAVCQQQ